MSARAKFQIGQRVRLSAYGREREADHNQRGRKTGDGIDRTRGVVVGFSPKHPSWVYVRRDGFKDVSRASDMRLWEADPDALKLDT